MINSSIQSAKYRLKNHDFERKEIEASIHEILTATSKNIDIDCNWSFNYHYSVKRPNDKTTFVFKAKHRDLPYFVAVKYLHQKSSESSPRARAEFEKLAGLYDKLEPKHRSIVARPIASTSHGYACEWVNLFKMQSILLASSFAQSNRKKCIEAAAANLRLMHDALGFSSRPMKATALVEKLYTSGGTSKAWNIALQKFIELSGKFDNQMVPHGPIHADYTPGNILFGKKRCVIFDFGRTDKFEPIYWDAANFLMYVSAYSTFGLRDTLQKRVNEDILTFMSAYGDKDEYDLKFIYFIYLSQAIRRWGRHESKGINVNRKFYLRWYDKLASWRLEWLCGEIFRLLEQHNGHKQP